MPWRRTWRGAGRVPPREALQLHVDDGQQLRALRRIPPARRRVRSAAPAAAVPDGVPMRPPLPDGRALPPLASSFRSHPPSLPSPLTERGWTDALLNAAAEWRHVRAQDRGDGSRLLGGQRVCSFHRPQPAYPAARCGRARARGLRGGGGAGGGSCGDGLVALNGCAALPGSRLRSEFVTRRSSAPVVVLIWTSL